MFEEEDDELSVPRGFVNAFILQVLIFMVIGTIWGLVK